MTQVENKIYTNKYNISMVDVYLHILTPVRNTPLIQNILTTPSKQVTINAKFIPEDDIFIDTGTIICFTDLSYTKSEWQF